LREHAGGLVGLAAAHELEQRALAERERRDRPGLEVAVLAEPRAVDPVPVLAPVAVQVHEAGVETPAVGQITPVIEPPRALLALGDEPREHGRIRLGRGAAGAGAGGAAGDRTRTQPRAAPAH